MFRFSMLVTFNIYLLKYTSYYIFPLMKNDGKQHDVVFIFTLPTFLKLISIQETCYNSCTSLGVHKRTRLFRASLWAHLLCRYACRVGTSLPWFRCSFTTFAQERGQCAPVNEQAWNVAQFCFSFFLLVRWWF